MVAFLEKFTAFGKDFSDIKSVATLNLMFSVSLEYLGMIIELE